MAIYRGSTRFYREEVGSMVEMAWALTDEELKAIIENDGVIHIAVQSGTLPVMDIATDSFENMNADEVSFRSERAESEWRYLMVKADNLESCYHAYTGYLTKAREKGLGWFSLRHFKSEIRHYERQLNNVYRRLDRLAKQSISKDRPTEGVKFVRANKRKKV